MDRELARKRPANTRPATATAVSGTAVIRRKERWDVCAEADRLVQRGVVERYWKLSRDEDAHEWVAMVTMRPARPHTWLRPVLWATGVLTALALAVWVVVRLVAALVALLPFILGGLGVIVVIAVMILASGGGDTKTINIKM